MICWTCAASLLWPPFVGSTTGTAGGAPSAADTWHLLPCSRRLWKVPRTMPSRGSLAGGTVTLAASDGIAYVFTTSRKPVAGVFSMALVGFTHWCLGAGGSMW